MFVCVREDVCESVGLNFMTLGNIFPRESDEMVTLRHVHLKILKTIKMRNKCC